MIKVFVKKNNRKIKLPVYKTSGSSGMDIIAANKKKIAIRPGNTKIIPTGLFLTIPKNYEIQIRPRSGLAAKNGISVLNTPGTIDSDYRGEIKVILINFGKKSFLIKEGDRIAQMVLCPVVKMKFKEVKKLNKTIRGKGGFGSTGK
tara:strand:+ start:603 stop:1040 length:438 start_codon:yes stop_codon:yes gene_type:complete